MWISICHVQQLTCHKFSSKNHVVVRYTYFSSKEYIFFKAASHGSLGSSTNVVTRFSNFIRSWYSKDASLNASAFPSGQSKCFRTALSSTLIKDEEKYTIKQRDR